MNSNYFLQSFGLSNIKNFIKFGGYCVEFSPLRYPGGKGRLTKFFKSIIETNSLFDCTYCEPYAGGAGIAINLLFQEYVSNIIINDLDTSIYAFWHSVVKDTDNLIRLIWDTHVTIKEWEKQKNIQRTIQQHSMLDVGFSTFFLNRTNRSGIITGGVIGGRSQGGKWKIDARYNKKELVRRIKKIALYSERIQLHNLDASILLEQLSNNLPPKFLLYLDPPYYSKGKRLYKNIYDSHDHILIRDIIARFPDTRWVVSYDETSKIADIYDEYSKLRYVTSYSAGRATTGRELIIFGPGLSIPSDYNDHYNMVMLKKK